MHRQDDQLKPVLIVAPNAITKVCSKRQKDAETDDRLTGYHLALPGADYILIIVGG